MNKKYLCRLSQWEKSEWKMRAAFNLYDILKKHTGTNSVFQAQLRVAELTLKETECAAVIQKLSSQAT